MSQIVTEKTQQLEGFYRIIESSSKYWEIRGNIVKQHEPYELTPESNEIFSHGKYSLLGCSWVRHEGQKICCRYFFPDGRCKALCVPLGPQDHEVLIDEN